MASPSYTYTLTNGATADASQVAQNFNDILNGVTDGTKDLSISALTCAGTATLNGHVNLGNASADDLNIAASLASSLLIKTTNAYDIGSATLGLRKLYLGNSGGSTTVALSSASSIASSRVYTLPDVAGAGIVQVSLGVNPVSSANYTILDNDGYHTILVSTGASQRTITLPAVANNSGRKIFIKKTDSGAGTVLIDTPGAETIDGAAQNILTQQYSYVELLSDGTNWFVTQVSDWLEVSSGPSLVNAAASTTAAQINTLGINQGRWGLYAVMELLRGDASTNISGINYITISTTSASMTGIKGGNAGWDLVSVGFNDQSVNDNSFGGVSIGPIFTHVTSVTTHYLNAVATYSATAPKWRGSIIAHRVG